jgi:hypothetical protein
MGWEALGWSALAVLSPLLVNLLWIRWRPPQREYRQLLRSAAPWLHGLGPPYLALITGAILERDLGLRGHDLVEWIAGGAFALIFSALWAAMLVRVLGLQSNPYLILDEPRFALYRATGRLWLVGNHIGLLMGLALALVEWLLQWREKAFRREPEAFVPLVPLASSTLVFALTGNLYLTLAAQAAVPFFARWLVRYQK